MAGTMHFSPIEEILYGLTEDGDWEGDVSAPTGAWFTIDLGPENVASIEANGFDLSPELKGWWIIREDSDGNVTFRHFPIQAGFLKEQTYLESTYAQWDIDNDDENERQVAILEAALDGIEGL